MFDGQLGVRAQPDRRARTQPRPDLAALYERHAIEVYRYVHRRCRDAALAEDVTQDTFLAAVRTVDDPGEVTVGWLIRVARNRLLDVLRRQARYEGKLQLASGRSEVADEPAAVVGRLRMTAALEELRVEHRIVLMLHYGRGARRRDGSDAEGGRGPADPRAAGPAPGTGAIRCVTRT